MGACRRLPVAAASAQRGHDRSEYQSAYKRSCAYVCPNWTQSHERNNKELRG